VPNESAGNKARAQRTVVCQPPIRHSPGDGFRERRGGRMAHRGQGPIGIEAPERPSFPAEKKTTGIADSFSNLFAMTRPAFSQGRTFEKARQLAFSAIAGLGRRTVSGMLCAGAMQFGDWSGAYRLFERERIDRHALFAPIMQEVLAGLSPDEPLVLMMDDTLVRKRGKKVHGTGWKRDPLGPPFHTNFVWGQRFLQISAALPDKDCSGRARGIPIDFIHAPSASKPKRNAPATEWEDYRKRQATMKVSTVASVRLKGLSYQVAPKREQLV